MRVPGAVEAVWLAGLADRLAWPASSVTVSVIVLGLTGWLVTCFFGCPGARDARRHENLRGPRNWNADLVAMLGAPGLMSSLGLLVCRYLRVPGDLLSSWNSHPVAMLGAPGS